MITQAVVAVVRTLQVQQRYHRKQAAAVTVTQTQLQVQVLLTLAAAVGQTVCQLLVLHELVVLAEQVAVVLVAHQFSMMLHQLQQARLAQ
jgi:energy-converting hydrogenase Eha subunit G